MSEYDDSTSLLYVLQYGIEMIGNNTIPNDVDILSGSVSIISKVENSDFGLTSGEANLIVYRYLSDKFENLKSNQNDSVEIIRKRIHKILNAVVDSDSIIKDNIRQGNDFDVAKSAAFDLLFKAVVDNLIGIGSDEDWVKDWNHYLDIYC